MRDSSSLIKIVLLVASAIPQGSRLRCVAAALCFSLVIGQQSNAEDVGEAVVIYTADLASYDAEYINKLIDELAVLRPLPGLSALDFSVPSSSRTGFNKAEETALLSRLDLKREVWGSWSEVVAKITYQGDEPEQAILFDGSLLYTVNLPSDILPVAIVGLGAPTKPKPLSISNPSSIRERIAEVTSSEQFVVNESSSANVFCFDERSDGGGSRTYFVFAPGSDWQQLSEMQMPKAILWGAINGTGDFTYAYVRVMGEYERLPIEEIKNLLAEYLSVPSGTRLMDSRFGAASPIQSTLIAAEGRLSVLDDVAEFANDVVRQRQAPEMATRVSSVSSSDFEPQSDGFPLIITVLIVGVVVLLIAAGLAMYLRTASGSAS